MPQKKTPNGKQYTVNGKTFTWTTEDGDTVTLPMRIKVKVLRVIAKQEMDVDTMFQMLEAIAPTQGDTLDEMDINDFQAMFVAWQDEYAALTGATPGE